MRQVQVFPIKANGADHEIKAHKKNMAPCRFFNDNEPNNALSHSRILNKL